MTIISFRIALQNVIDVCGLVNMVILLYISSSSPLPSCRHLHNSIQCTSVYHSRCFLLCRHRNVNHLPFGSISIEFFSLHCRMPSISFHFCLKIILLFALQFAHRSSSHVEIHLNMPSIYWLSASRSIHQFFLHLQFILRWLRFFFEWNVKSMQRLVLSYATATAAHDFIDWVIESNGIEPVQSLCYVLSGSFAIL